MSITGNRMKQRRKELGISAEEIAAYLNISPASVYRYENGDIEKLPGTILAPLSSILQTTPEYLMGWSEDIHRHNDKTIDPSLQELFDMIAQLDYEDRAEIKGEVKHMLKADKYRQNEESKNA